ncbi:ParB/RepB/Spo0J family partition protein [Azospira sp. I13]|uniref:ParB/RepB/Spo0J family partition protein n=1 Tax=Azospira sp. I13 TaxID=1765050 RepID=UPI000D58F5F2|nr:ParB/RepB/Spo0J family partition protein [Azospira sp. I13]
MAFKDTPIEFQWLEIDRITVDSRHVRQHLDDTALQGLVNAIRQKGMIHPLVVQPAGPDGRHTLIVGQRRWRAAQLAGEARVPALIRNCSDAEAKEVQVFENLGLGVRAALDPLDMANALQAVTDAYPTPEEAATLFGRSANWLAQATAAARLTPQVSALLETGKITSTSTALQLDKLARKDEARAETLLGQIAQLPEGEKVPKQVVETVLVEAGVRRGKKKKEEAEADTPAPSPVAAPAPASLTSPTPGSDLPPWEEAPAAPPAAPLAAMTSSGPAAPARPRVNPGKVRLVAEILGLAPEDEEEVLERLIDEFLALKGEGNPPF